MPVTMLTRALMGPAAPEGDEQAPQPNVRAAVAGPQFKTLTQADKSRIRDMRRKGGDPDDIVKEFSGLGYDPEHVRSTLPSVITTPADVAGAVNARTTSSTTGTPRVPVVPVRHGGVAPGMTPRVSVSVQQHGMAQSDDEALRSINQQFIKGEVPAPAGWRQAKTEKDQLAFLRTMSQPELDKLRKPNPPASTPAPPSARGQRAVSRMAPVGVNTQTTHVVPRATFTLPTQVDIGSIVRTLPSTLQHLDAVQAGNPQATNVHKLLYAYHDQFGKPGQMGKAKSDPLLSRIAETYVQNSGNSVAQNAIASIAKGYTSFLRAAENATKNGWNTKDIGDAYNHFTTNANDLLHSLGTADTGSIKSQASAFNLALEKGVLGAMRQSYSKNEFDELASKTDEPHAMHFKPDQPVVQGNLLEQATNAVKRAGVTVAVNKLTSEFRKPGMAPNSNFMDAATTAKGQLIEALAFHPESPLNKILTEQIQSSISGIEKTNGGTLQRLASAIRAGKSGGAHTGGDVANTFDANIAKQLNIPDFLMSNIGLHFGGRTNAGGYAGGFVPRVTTAINELRKGLNTNWTVVADALRPYLSDKDFDMIMPRTGHTREFKSTNKRGEPVSTQVNYSPSVEKQKLYTDAFAEITGVPLTASGKNTGIPNYGPRALQILQEVQKNNPTLFAALEERSLKAPKHGLDVGDVSGQGKGVQRVYTNKSGEATGAQTYNANADVALNQSRANAIWYSLTRPQRAHDYVPGKVNVTSGIVNQTPGELLHDVMQHSDTFKSGLKHTAEPSEIGTHVTRGQEQKIVNNATVQRPEGQAATRNDIDQLVRYYDRFGIHPTAFDGITPKADGTPAQQQLYHIMNDPTAKAQWEDYKGLEKKAVAALASQTVEGGVHGTAVVAPKSAAKTKNVISSEIASIADQYVPQGADPKTYREKTGQIINYLSSLHTHAKRYAGLDIPLVDKFMGLQRSLSPDQFAEFNPVGRVDNTLPGNMNWAEANKMAAAVEALTRAHGNNNQKEMFVRAENDNRQPGFKVLRMLSTNPEKVFAVINDLRNEAGMPTPSRPAPPKSAISRPTEDAALRSGQRTGAENLTHEVMGAVDAALGRSNPNEIGNKGPSGKAYQAPGEPVRDQPVHQSFMKGVPATPKGALDWYIGLKDMVDRVFDNGSIEKMLGLRMARQLSTGHSVEDVVRTNSADGMKPKVNRVLEMFKRQGINLESAPAGRRGMMKSVLKGGKVLGAGGLVINAFNQGRQTKE